MRKIFHVRIFASPNGAFREVELDLPAAEYALLDTVEQLRPEAGQHPYLEFHAGEDYDYLEKRIQEPGIFQLNALAKQLAELDSHGMAAFEGLVCMDLQKGEEPIPLPRLIDYAYSGDCCHVVEDAATDEELGRFLAENGFVPEAEGLPDKVFELLDFAQIGKSHREAEGGAFTSWGYVERHSEWKEVYKTLDLSAPAPDYMILLKVSHNDDSTLLKLPTHAEALSSVPQMLDEPDWLDLSLECLDCCVPALMDAVARTDDIASLNCLAEKLEALEPQELTAYKALLKATNCQDLDNAGFLIGQLDSYNFCPEYSSPSDVAEGQLHVILGEQEARLLLPHLNLDGYGKELLRHYGSALTPYGLLEKKDNTPVMSEEDQPKTGGMEMMQ